MPPKPHPSPASHPSHAPAPPDTASPTGRNKPAQGKDPAPAGDAALGHASQNTSSPEGAKQAGSSSCIVPLDQVARHHSGNSKLIKGKLHDAPAENLFPAFSATGQDVWRDAFDREGDAIIISAVGARCGKCFLARGRWSAIANTHVVWPDPEKADIKFLWYLLNDEQFWIRSGSAQPFVAVRKTFEKEIFVPPLPEQRRIVAEIEKQFTRLEAGVAALRRVQANLKRYRAVVLKAACEGRLVPTEAALARSPRSTKNGPPAYETGAALLARILTERRQNWQGRGQYKEPAAPVTAHLPPFPAGWAAASLEQLTSPDRPICYGILMPKENVATGVLFVKVKDMKGDTIDLEGLHRTTPEIAAKYARASLRTGDLLLSIRGTYGRVAEVPKELDGGNITQDTARLDVTGLVNHRYVATCLRNPDCQNHFKRVARGVAVKGVNIGDVRPTPVPLPPLAEQTRIVAEVERRLSVVEELESVVTANLQRATRLRQSILQKAFTGQLH